MRSGDKCECDEGWSGINCNVCTSHQACDALMPTGDGGVCYQNGEVVKNNYQICDVVNKKITTLLGTKKPEVTFTCKKEDETCQFQCMDHRTHSLGSSLLLPATLGPSASLGWIS